MDPDWKRRADERRLRMVGGTARSFDELEDAGLRQWTETTFEDRL